MHFIPRCTPTLAEGEVFLTVRTLCSLFSQMAVHQHQRHLVRRARMLAESTAAVMFTTPGVLGRQHGKYRSVLILEIILNLRLKGLWCVAWIWYYRVSKEECTRPDSLKLIRDWPQVQPSVSRDATIDVVCTTIFWRFLSWTCLRVSQRPSNHHAFHQGSAIQHWPHTGTAMSPLCVKFTFSPVFRTRDMRSDWMLIDLRIK